MSHDWPSRCPAVADISLTASLEDLSFKKINPAGLQLEVQVHTGSLFLRCNLNLLVEIQV
jgi:hypothetical protein